MEIYKTRHTRLQQEILRYLFLDAGPFTANALARRLKVSPTAVIKAVKNLEYIKTGKDRESKRLSISLDREQAFQQTKRVENLRMLYESKLPEKLSDLFAGATLILFGSFAYGEDTQRSDIDLAIVGASERKLDLRPYALRLRRPISLQFFGKFTDIDKNLKENLCNGIVLAGGIQL